MLHSLAPSSSTNPRPMTACGLCSRRCFSPRLTAILSHPIPSVLAARRTGMCGRVFGSRASSVELFCRVLSSVCRGRSLQVGLSVARRLWAQYLRSRGAPLALCSHACAAVAGQCMAVARADLGSSEVGLVVMECL